MFQNCSANYCNQRGFSLIEVLISLLVLAVGLLGLGGLQVASLKGASNAHSRNVATMAAMELADRMRANPLGVSGGFYGNEVSCTGGKACRRNTYCTPQEVAAFDIQEVMCGMKRGTKREGGIKNLLINGTLDISCNAGCTANKAVHNITISWGEKIIHPQLDENDATKTLTLSVMP